MREESLYTNFEWKDVPKNQSVRLKDSPRYLFPKHPKESHFTETGSYSKCGRLYWMAQTMVANRIQISDVDDEEIKALNSEASEKKLLHGKRLLLQMRMIVLDGTKDGGNPNSDK